MSGIGVKRASSRVGRDPLFRVFGSPYAVATHQHVTYLQLKRLPVKTYCGTFASSKLYSMFFGAKSAFCTLTPQKNSCLLPWHLMERVERDEAQHFPHARRLLLDRSVHPQLHMLSWLLMVYANWWLALTGMMHRWVEGDGTSIIAGYMNYFLLMSGLGVLGPLRERFRKMMCGLLSLHGVSDASRPFMVDHFDDLCAALDAHCNAMEKVEAKATTVVAEVGAPAEASPYYLLGTPHPTLADVAMGSVFSAYYLLDDQVAAALAERFPHLGLYLNRVGGFARLRNGEWVPPPPSDAEEDAELADFPDTVPESLKPVLMLMEEVLPFVVDQCGAFRTFMAGDGVRQLQRCTLEEDDVDEETGNVATGLAGLEAFVLPQRTPISTVMLVDRHIISVFCRAQDLEIATIAAREVLDVELATFNRLLEDAAPPKSTTGADGMERDKGHSEGGRDVSQPPPEAPTVDAGAMPSGDVALTADAASSKPAPALSEILRNGVSTHDDALPSEPTSPHAFSRKGRKDYHRFSGALQHRKESRITQRSTADVMRSLFAMVQGMHSPQFTLSAVTQNRRIFVAVIPEHEYAKKRARDQVAAREGRASSAKAT